MFRHSFCHRQIGRQSRVGAVTSFEGLLSEASTQEKSEASGGFGTSSKEGVMAGEIAQGACDLEQGGSPL